LAHKIAQLEAELRRERELSQAAEAALATAREALDAEIHARDEFFAAAAHDLKTPLAALALQTQMLLRGDPSADPDRLRSRVKGMRRQITHMTGLIDRLLDASQISAGGLRLFVEDVDLTAVVREVAARLTHDLEFARCPLNLRAERPFVGRWDPIRIDQVVTNLLANAMKYGEGKPIDVVVEGDERSVRIVVRDYGIGIAPADQERIFEKFQRLATSQLAGGVGLGLWIVRGIVEASGGFVELSSKPGEGSTFTVRLPIRSA
jgi:signal transduction histidine kinase